MMAHFPPKSFLNTHSYTYRGLWFRLVYTSPGSRFSARGSEGFEEAQLYKNKIGIPSYVALSFFSKYLAQKESVHYMITVLWMDYLQFLPQVKNKSANKGRRRDLNASVTLHVLPPKATYLQVQTVPLLIYYISLAMNQLLCRGALHFALTMEGA